MKRIDITESLPQPVTVPRRDYEADRRRGFCVVEFSPAGEMIIKNPRRPDQFVRRPIEATLLFRCMKCQFDVIDSEHTPDPKTHERRSGLTIIQAHLQMNEHPWPYTPFSNPYGDNEDVIIEGVDDYTKEIANVASNSCAGNTAEVGVG